MCRFDLNLMPSFLEMPLQVLTAIGDVKATLLRRELNLHTVRDLVEYYPLRYEDQSHCCAVKALLTSRETKKVRLQGVLLRIEHIGSGKPRLVAWLQDATGQAELIWFRNSTWWAKTLQTGAAYAAFGRATFYQNNKVSMVHPELTRLKPDAALECAGLQPVYKTTEKMKRAKLGTRALTKLQRSVWHMLSSHRDDIQEFLPSYIKARYRLIERVDALRAVHFPSDASGLHQAYRRLKFEELFFVQLQLLTLRRGAGFNKPQGRVYKDVSLLRRFSSTGLPFTLTLGQKKVMGEIYRDLCSGTQMNRLLQGDVGSGKTVVALMAMLLVLSSGAQAAVMAPTELLAEQHYRTIQALTEGLNITLGLLTGSVKSSRRERLLSDLAQGHLQIVVGTHALLNHAVTFNQLGLVVVDEQHRFGVAQRAELWSKASAVEPHVLVMTATPIPRTLAMTLYGDLDLSVIDTLPAGRKPVQTLHCTEAHRLKAFQLVYEQVKKGRQAYIIYPLIEESASLDYVSLLEGYESVQRAFPDFVVGIVHGRMDAAAKAYEMRRFEQQQAHVLVSTTVIEVGVNVPNATVMIIEGAERFGLAQLHQLRGRVGRSDAQSYCVLMTAAQLNPRSRARMLAMLQTTDGFKIADMDLHIRGPGDLTGLQQSGLPMLKVSNLEQDSHILQTARKTVQDILRQDPKLECPVHEPIKRYLTQAATSTTQWSRVS